MKKTETEWSAVLICEFVFGFIGTLFTVLGVIFGFLSDEMTVNPNSHGNVSIIPWIFCAIGIAFLLAFAVLFFISMKRRNNRIRLIEDGSCIDARVTEVRQDTFVRINKKFPYYVICEGTNPYTGEKLTFRSSDVTENLSYLVGENLRVFVDYENPQNYYVDIHRKYDDGISVYLSAW